MTLGDGGNLEHAYRIIMQLHLVRHRSARDGCRNVAHLSGAPTHAQGSLYPEHRVNSAAVSEADAAPGHLCNSGKCGGVGN